MAHALIAAAKHGGQVRVQILINTPVVNQFPLAGCNISGASMQGRARSTARKLASACLSSS